MADMTLTATPALEGYDRTIGTMRLAERTSLSLVSMAIPLDGEGRAATAVRKHLHAELPPATGSTLSSDGSCRIIQTAADQYMAIFEHHNDAFTDLLTNALDGAVYVTDQSDVWVGLSLTGPDAVDALERLCPIDLHDSNFPVGASARTVMEHMGTIILRTGQHDYLLLSARSSAGSFLHAVETSVRYTQP